MNESSHHFQKCILSDPNKNYPNMGGEKKKAMWFDNMGRRWVRKSYPGFFTAGLLESLIYSSEAPWDDYNMQHFSNLLNAEFFLLRKRC